MTEYINQILAHTDLFVSGVVGLCVIGGILIEYSPIPLNPVRWLGNRLNQDLKKDINNVRKDVSDLDKRLDKIEESGLQRDLQSKRSIVLDFAYKLRKTDDEENKTKNNTKAFIVLKSKFFKNALFITLSDKNKRVCLYK